MNKYTLYAVQIDQAATGTDWTIDQIRDFAIDPAIAQIVRASDGAVDPTFVGVMGQSPRVSIASSAVATILTQCGLNALAIEGDSDEAGAVMFFQALAEGGTRGGDGTNIKMTMHKGFLIPGTISASQGTEAVANLELVGLYDADRDPVVDPIVIATDQNLSGTPQVDELFTVGPASINGTDIEGVQAVTIDFGITEIIRGGDGSVWPTYAAIMARRPSIRITTEDVDLINTIGFAGLAQDATDSVVYLRKLAEGGTRVANATAQHIKFTIDEGLITFESVRSAQGQVAGTDIVITPTYDGTNAIIVIDAASAIT